MQAGSGAVATRREVDPLGSEVGASDPFAVFQQPLYTDIYGGESLFMEAGDPLDLRGGCMLDGMAVSCSYAMQALNSGAAVYDPGLQWGRRRNPQTGRAESFVERIAPTYSPISSDLSLPGAVFVPDYNDSSRDYYDRSSDAVVGVTSGRFVYTGASRFTTSVNPQNSFLKGRFKFSEDELRRLSEAYTKITSDACEKFFDKVLSEIRQNKGLRPEFNRWTPRTLKETLSL